MYLHITPLNDVEYLLLSADFEVSAHAIDQVSVSQWRKTLFENLPKLVEQCLLVALRYSLSINLQFAQLENNPNYAMQYAVLMPCIHFTVMF